MMHCMRTTLNIDDDLLRKLKGLAQRQGAPFRRIVNRAISLGLERMQPERSRARYACPTFSMGFPPVPSLDKALQLAALLEDEETVHKLSLGK